jgi:hypothetical protein
MSIQDRLQQFWDVFALRHAVHGPGYKPEEISDRLRNRVLMLYADVVSGRMPTSSYVSAEDNSHQFWEEVHHALRTGFGRPVLSRARVHSAAEDAMAFAQQASAAELFTFIEASFKLQISWRIFHDEDEFVDALNSIFRLEGSPYQVIRGVQRREPHGSGEAIIRVAFPKVVRVDDEVAHTAAIQPALSALTDPAYAGANNEFRKALDDYRQGDFEDCLGQMRQRLRERSQGAVSKEQDRLRPKPGHGRSSAQQGPGALDARRGHVQGTLDRRRPDAKPLE